MAQQMGWGDSFGLRDGCFKRKNRWLFTIPEISAEGINALPPSKASRPGLSFKELSMEHLTETIYYPGKPEWKPITLTLYDLRKEQSHYGIGFTVFMICLIIDIFIQLDSKKNKRY